MQDTILDIGRGETLVLPPRKTLVGGLSFRHFFSKSGEHPYDECRWEKRKVSIMDYAKGKPSFLRDNVEVPAHWSDNSVRITAAKYLFGSKEGEPEYEDSFRHPFDRIANTYTVWGWKNGYFRGIEDAKTYNWELKTMLVRQIWAPNSPVWFNIGHWEQWRWGRADLRETYSHKGNKAYKAFETGEGGLEVREIPNSLEHPQMSACFLTEVDDSMESILAHGVTEGRIFSSGSGVGINISTLRSTREPIAGRGRSSGPISFNKGWDRMAGAIKSGGRSRRAARMVIMDSDHPDIFSFVGLKNSQEQLAKVILREHNSKVALERISREKGEGGDAEKLVDAILSAMPSVNDKEYDGSMDGEVYGETVSDQNANHSVSLRGDYWKEYWADGNYSTRWVTHPDKIQDTFKAKKLLHAMAEAVYHNAEPGCHNNDYINLWSPIKSRGRINTSNPCVTGDTLVAGNGLASIESLVGREPKVVNRNGGLSVAKAVFPTGTKPVYRLETKSGFSLKLTADHKVDTANRGDVAACELSKDDLVVLRGAEFGNERAHPTIAYLAGLALGDGCVTQADEQRAVVWTFGSHEKNEAERVAQLINAYKSENPTGDGRSDAEVGVTQTSTGYKVTTSRPDIVQDLERLCVLDQGSTGKTLSSEALRLDKSSLSLILRGYGDADGCVANHGDKSQHVALDSCSERLLEQVQVILLGFGVKSKLYRNRRADKSGKALLPDGRGGTKLYSVVQMHSLRISREGRVAYEEQIGFGNASKKDKLSTLNAEVGAYSEAMTDGVKSLEYVGELPVYDLTEPETSHFVANGILVHNCSEYLHANNTSCNLASFNAYRFLKDGRIDKTSLRTATRLAMVAADLNVEEGGFPIPEIAEWTYRYRTTGIGFGNIGGLLMALGIPYDSDEGRYIAGLLTSELTAGCWQASAEMGRELGAYREWADTVGDLSGVIRLHALCHDLLLRIPELGSGKLRADEAVELALEGAAGEELPRAEGLSGLDALNALVRSFSLSGQWDAARLGAAGELGQGTWAPVNARDPMRNSFTSLYAPMGTISAPLGIYDEGTTSAEPDYTLVKYKSLSGGGTMTMFNSLALAGLKAMGYDEFRVREAAFEVAGVSGLIVACGEDRSKATNHLRQRVDEDQKGPVRKAFDEFMAGREVGDVSGLLDGDSLPALVRNGTGNVEGIPWLPPHHKDVFDCAATTGGGTRAIPPSGHIRMLGALAPFISGAVSKTVNLPHYATVDEIVRCFEMSHQMGVKCIALYRAGSKGVSVFAADDPEAAKWSPQAIWTDMVEAAEGVAGDIRKDASKPRRRKMPGRRSGQIIKFEIGGSLDGFLIIGTYPDGRCGEVFGRLGKCGSFAHGMFESFCKAFSVMLQWGVPLDKAIGSFRNLAFDPSGFARIGDMGEETDVKSCKSVVDLMMRILEWLFPAGNGYRLRGTPGDPDCLRDGESATVLNMPAESSEGGGGTAPSDLGAAEMCPECHSLSVIQDGKCKRCINCGFSNGGCGG